MQIHLGAHLGASQKTPGRPSPKTSGRPSPLSRTAGFAEPCLTPLVPYSQTYLNSCNVHPRNSHRSAFFRLMHFLSNFHQLYPMTLPITQLIICILIIISEFHFLSFFFTFPLRRPSGGAPLSLLRHPVSSLPFFLRIPQGGALRAPPWVGAPPQLRGQRGCLDRH